MTHQIDTNVLLRYLTLDMPAQANQAEEMFDRAQKGQVQLEVSEPVFIELVVALRNYFKYPKDKVVEMLETLLSQDWIKFENHFCLSKAIGVFSKHNLDLVDCLIFVRAQEKNQKLFTFDARLASIASSI